MKLTAKEKTDILNEVEAALNRPSTRSLSINSEDPGKVMIYVSEEIQAVRPQK